MGLCNPYMQKKEQQIAQLPPSQFIYKVKTQVYHQQQQQLALPIKVLPQLSQQIKITIKDIGPFDYSKSQKHQRGKILGPHKFKNSTIYLGEWNDSKPHGRGVFYLPDQSFFQGVIVNGKIEGYGRIINKDGSYFEGQFKNGQGNGYGKFVQDDITYEGSFKNNLQHGDGVQYNKLYEFRGEFHQGQKKKGKLTMKKRKLKYEGQFKNNKFHGFGVLSDDIEKYVGYFMNGLKNGQGKLYDNQGNLYQGSFKEGKKNGKGKLFDNDGILIATQVWKGGELKK